MEKSETAIFISGRSIPLILKEYVCLTSQLSKSLYFDVFGMLLWWHYFYFHAYKSRTSSTAWSTLEYTEDIHIQYTTVLNDPYSLLSNMQCTVQWLIYGTQLPWRANYWRGQRETKKLLFMLVELHLSAVNVFVYQFYAQMFLPDTDLLIQVWLVVFQFLGRLLF